MLYLKQIQEIEEYITSGRLEEEFLYSPDERRYELLEFLEKLMDVAELADAAATRIIFKDSQLGALVGIKPTEPQ